MATLTQLQLRPLIESSADMQELKTKVAHQFGSEHIPAALLLAVQLNGAKWVFGEAPQDRSAAYRFGHSLRRRLPEVMATGFAVALLCALANPPFMFVTESGVTFHMGFHSIFSVPSGGTMGHGAVNVPLLAIECLVISAVGGVAFFVALRLNKRAPGVAAPGPAR